MNPALVILAAGASTRLSTCKALAPITPRNPLELLVEAGSACDGAPPLVVSGADHARIARALPRCVALVFNARWSLGRTGTVALATRVRRGLDLCLAPVDVPLVPRSVFESLARAWTAAGSPARGWLAPRLGARFGHPVVVGHALLEELAGFEADVPLARLRDRASPCFHVDVQALEILDDLDTEVDLATLRARFTNEGR